MHEGDTLNFSLQHCRKTRIIYSFVMYDRSVLSQFPDLVEFCETMANSGKTVIVAALDGTFQRKVGTVSSLSVHLIMCVIGAAVRVSGESYTSGGRVSSSSKPSVIFAFVMQHLPRDWDQKQRYCNKPQIQNNHATLLTKSCSLLLTFFLL